MSLTSILSTDLISTGPAVINGNFAQVATTSVLTGSYLTTSVITGTYPTTSTVSGSFVAKPITASILGSGTADTTTFLRGDLSWIASGGSAIIALGGPISFPASTTCYIDTMGTGFGVATTETDIGFIVPFAGTLSKLYLRSKETLSGTAGQTIVYTVMVNGVASGITFTQTVGDTSQIYSDLTHSVAVAAGDRVTIRAVTGAISANTGRLSGGGIKLA